MVAGQAATGEAASGTGKQAPAPAGRTERDPMAEQLTRVREGGRNPAHEEERAGAPISSVGDAEAAEVRGERSRRGIHPAIPFLVAILLIVGVLVGLIVMKRKDPDLGPPVATGRGAIPAKQDEEGRLRFLRDGWKEEASNTLSAFLRAATVDAKARVVIGGPARREEMQSFYGEDGIAEADTPVELFSHFDLDIADKKRGLFLMQYERPAQFDMRELFRPVAPLEVQHRIEQPGLLLSAYSARDNFAMEPMRVMAFFKEADGGLRLDWDVYTQTKYRTLRHFVTYPQPGASKVFRVMVREELPASSGADVTNERRFRFSDPAHVQDYVQIPVPANSLPGRILADIAWINLPGRQAQDRYATVELAWISEEDPQVIVRKVICWEFLGLGGVAGNADPVDDSPLATAVEPDLLGADPLPSAPPSSGIEPVGVPGGASPQDPDAGSGSDLPGAGESGSERSETP